MPPIVATAFASRTLFGTAGSLVGEGGALGIAAKRSTQVSAWKAGDEKDEQDEKKQTGQRNKRPNWTKSISPRFSSTVLANLLSLPRGDLVSCDSSRKRTTKQANKPTKHSKAKQNNALGEDFFHE